MAGECAVEYLGLYQKLIKPTHWKVYLAARGVLPYIGNLITKVMLLNSEGDVFHIRQTFCSVHQMCHLFLNWIFTFLCDSVPRK